jgi:hypothetical protein
LATNRHHYAGRGWLELTFFAVGRFDGTPTNLVFADMRWVSVSDLATLDFLDADREFVRRLANGEVAIA